MLLLGADVCIRMVSEENSFVGDRTVDCAQDAHVACSRSCVGVLVLLLENSVCIGAAPWDSRYVVVRVVDFAKRTHESRVVVNVDSPCWTRQPLDVLLECLLGARALWLAFQSLVCGRTQVFDVGGGMIDRDVGRAQ